MYHRSKLNETSKVHLFVALEVSIPNYNKKQTEVYVFPVIYMGAVNLYGMDYLGFLCTVLFVKYTVVANTT